MKKLSLKALGATLLSAGLVLTGVAGSAHAASITATASTTQFTASTATAAGFTATLPSATFVNTLDTIVFSVGTTTAGAGRAWARVNTCPSFANASAGNESACGITAVKFNGVAVTGWKAYATDVYYNAVAAQGIRLYKSNAGTGYTTGQDITVEFAAGAYTTPATAANYTMKLDTLSNGGGSVDNGTATLTVGTASSTVTFNGNGSTGGSTASQVSAVPAALTANGFSKTGYDFSGWNTAQNGTGVAYSNSGSYGFVADLTLYAQWTASASGGSSASANLTFGATTGQLVAGSTVAVAASGLQTTAPFTVVVQSTPQTIGSGNATGGVVNTSVTLPAGLEAGWHTLTFSSTAADGSVVTSVQYFQVSASGTLLATTSTIPAALANTGFDGVPYLASGVLLALAGAVLLLIARRRMTI
jgi:uncharacterized repeat protein (TIGR02543 family)